MWPCTWFEEKGDVVMKCIGIIVSGGLLALLSACATFGATTPAENGELQVVLKDYDFAPGVIRVKAGQKVTIVLSNEGQKLHEFMVGRNLIVEDNFTEGFAEDFFAGITPEIHGPGMVMGLAGGDTEHDMDSMAESETMEDMDEMAAGETMAGDMAGMEHDMDSVMEGTFGLLARPSMDAHGGVMIMLAPVTIPSDQVTTITFTVPEDKVGAWEMGCFQERGQHYDDGMRGTLIVDPA